MMFPLLAEFSSDRTLLQGRWKPRRQGLGSPGKAMCQIRADLARAASNGLISFSDFPIY